jgi:hypothetical protein
MLKKEDLQVGMLVWWETYSECAVDSRPGKIMEIDEKKQMVEIFDFGDFKEKKFPIWELFPGEKFPDHRFKICSLNEFLNNLQSRKAKHEELVKETKKAFTEAKKRQKEFLKNIEIFLPAENK